MGPFTLAVALIVILVLAVPRRFFGNLLGWLAILAALLWIHLSHPFHRDHYDTGYALGLAGLFLAAVAIVAAIGLRLAVMYFLPGRNKPSDPTPPGPSAVSRLQLICAGVLSALLFSLVLRAVLLGISEAWVGHMVALFIVSAIWALPRLLPQTPPAPYMGAVFRSFRWSLVALLVGFTVLSTLVGRSAQELAGGRPYCIQVADGDNLHRPARTLLDLSGLTMQAWSQGTEQQHAVLVLGEAGEQRLLNWSYRQGRFVDEAAMRDSPDRWPALFCEPRADFVRHLPLLTAEEDTDVQVRILEQAFRIPAILRPRARGGYHPHLNIAVTAPGFLRYDPSIGSVPRPRNLDLYRTVTIWLRPGRRWEDRFEVPEWEEAVARGEIHDLTARGVSRKGSTATREQYLAGAPDGSERTLIECQAASINFPLSCEHLYFRDGLLFTFRHAPADLPAWREMQRRLAEIFETFSSEG